MFAATPLRCSCAFSNLFSPLYYPPHRVEELHLNILFWFKRWFKRWFKTFDFQNVWMNTRARCRCLGKQPRYVQQESVTVSDALRGGNYVRRTANTDERLPLGTDGLVRWLFVWWLGAMAWFDHLACLRSTRFGTNSRDGLWMVSGCIHGCAAIDASGCLPVLLNFSVKTFNRKHFRIKTHSKDRRFPWKRFSFQKSQNTQFKCFCFPKRLCSAEENKGKGRK